MKKPLLILILLFIGASLSAGVLDLFYPAISYSESARFMVKDLKGEFSFDEVPQISSSTRYMSPRYSYLFYGCGRHAGFGLEHLGGAIWMVQDSLVWMAMTDFDAVHKGQQYPPVFDEYGNLVANYHIVEDSANCFKLQNEAGWMVSFEGNEKWARELVSKGDVVVYCHWIFQWSDVGGVQVPTGECFYFTDLVAPYQILFKETKSIFGIGNDNGPFSEEQLLKLVDAYRGN